MNEILPWDESVNDTLITRIMRHEGFCAFPKIDVAPMYVIGFGHDLTKDECANYPDGITYEQAEELLEKDIDSVKLTSNNEFTWLNSLNSIRQDIIYEMCFQLGILGVSKFKQMISAIQSQNWTLASQSMLDSNWHKETPARCEELANLMASSINQTS